MGRVFIVSLIIGVLALGASRDSHAELVTSNWNTVTQGTLNGVGFTYSAPFSLVLLGVDLTLEPFAFEPLQFEQVLGVLPQSVVTFTFDEPIANLILYAANWHGETTDPADAPISYQLSQSFEVLSGFSTAAVDAGSITIDDSNPLASGVMRFVEPVSTLTIVSNYPGDIVFGSVRNGILLAVETAPVPLPGAVWLLLSGLVGMAGIRKSADHGV